VAGDYVFTWPGILSMLACLDGCLHSPTFPGGHLLVDAALPGSKIAPAVAPGHNRLFFFAGDQFHMLVLHLQIADP
jgi:hypothetical protein